MITTEDYRLSHANPEKGASYERDFRESQFLSFLWRREQAILDDVLRRRFPAGEPRCLDFACGTGRITEHLVRRGGRVTGIDVSASMLEQARARKLDVELIQADLTRDDVLAKREFDLITAFRFFPNAQDPLRLAVIKALASRLADGGVLVFNNHINASSTMCLLWRALGKPVTSFRPMTYGESARLIEDGGLQLLECHAIGVIPATARRMLVPEVVHVASDAVVNHLQLGRVLAQDLLFVCCHRRAVTS